MKVTKEIMLKLYSKYNDRADFIKHAIEDYKISKVSASRWWYLVKGQGKVSHVVSKTAVPSSDHAVGSLQANSTPPAPQAPAPSQPQIQAITPEQITVTEAQEHGEASELSDIYKKMIKEPITISTDASGPNYQSSSAPPEGSANANPEPDALNINPERNLRIKLRALAKTFGIAVNDNLIWKERPLSQDEKDLIDTFSGDLEAEFASSLDSPYSPYINYAAAVLVLPTIGRLDLVPGKLQGLAEWIKQYSKKSPDIPKPAYSGPAVVEEQKPANEGGKFSRYKENVRVWLESLEASGYKISPNYDETLALDRDAYINKIVRNLGDAWDG